MTAQINAILHTVARYYGVKREAIVSERRSKTLIRPRHVAIYLIRTLTPHSSPEIAEAFNRDHTVVLYAVRKIEARMQSDGMLKADIDLLSAKCASRVQLRRVA